MNDTILMARKNKDDVSRSLILAGGGIRVSYQAGVLQALQEHGLEFTHVDGTSGGIMNAAMLMSGLTPEEMCKRWRNLYINDFVSLMPLTDYIKAFDMLGMGDADGIREKVFPHLGIDLQKINQVDSLSASFNVCNFKAKTNEVISHTDVKLDHLIAGISLPIFMPPIDIDGTLYIDSVWIKDANLMEAVKRGAEEIWLVWLIGNTGNYETGAFNQYVHMIEMSANGALINEVAQIEALNQRIENGDSPYGQKSAIKLHVIKPTYPLPLDPDLFSGNIDNTTLIDMAYADTSDYLNKNYSPGVLLDEKISQMKNLEKGIRYQENLKGMITWNGTNIPEEVTLTLCVHINNLDDFIQNAEHVARLTGHISIAGSDKIISVHHGIANLFLADGEEDAKYMRYEMVFNFNGEPHYLFADKTLKDDAGFDAWSDISRAKITVRKFSTDGEIVSVGEAGLDLTGWSNLVLNIHPVGHGSISEGLSLVSDFGKFYMGEVYKQYHEAEDPWWKIW